MKRFSISAMLLVYLSACAPVTQNPDAVTPGAPANLTSQGISNAIILNWDAVSSEHFRGYHVYRSTNGSDFNLVTNLLLSQNLFTNHISSPQGDGVYYQYYVTALADNESLPSAPSTNIHGVRLTNHAGNLTINNGVYVVEGSLEITNGSLTVDPAAKLYFVPGSTLKLSAEKGINIQGLLRMEGTSSAPVIYTTIEASPVDNKGLGIRFYGNTIDYNPVDDSGSVIRYSILSNMRGSTAFPVLYVSDSAPLIEHNKFYANSSLGIGPLELWSGAPIIRDNFFTNCYLRILGVLGTGFSMTGNEIRHAYQTLYMYNISSDPFAAGSIISNLVDAHSSFVILDTVTATNVSLGGNYWSGVATNHFYANLFLENPVPALAAAPVPLGPGW